MTSILVTGGAGFIGSHTCKALRAGGLHPVTYDNLSRGNAEGGQMGSRSKSAISPTGSGLREVVARHRPAAVVHFAALAYIGESNEKPAAYYANNVGGTAALLEIMQRIPPAAHRIFQHLRGLRNARNRSNLGNDAPGADQSLRRQQDDLRAHAARMRRGVSIDVHGAALFQCRGCRS